LDGPQIGFSRGAYLCRALAAILDYIGMVPADHVVDALGTRGIDLIERAAKAYSDLFQGRKISAARSNLASIAGTLRLVRQDQPGTSHSGGTIVHAIGLFDSVCAFAWPRCLGGRGGDYIWSRMFGPNVSDEIVPPNVEYAFRASALSQSAQGSALDADAQTPSPSPRTA
jgi:hypothetical protein